MGLLGASVKIKIDKGDKPFIKALVERLCASWDRHSVALKSLAEAVKQKQLTLK